MSGPSQVKDVPIDDRSQLVEFLASGSKPPEQWRIGTEHEKFGFRLDDLRPLPFLADVAFFWALLAAAWGFGQVRRRVRRDLGRSRRRPSR